MLCLSYSIKHGLVVKSRTASLITCLAQLIAHADTNFLSAVSYIGIIDYRGLHTIKKILQAACM